MPSINMQTFEELRRHQLVTEWDVQSQSELDDYQVKLENVDNPIQAQDNLVVGVNGESLPHWNESVDFDTWVKMNIGISGKRGLLIHGNDGLSSGSSGVDTFDLFDFIGYTEVDPSSHITITNSKIDAIDVTTDAAYVHKTVPSITDFIHEFEYYRTSGASPYGGQAPIIIGDGYGTISASTWGTKNGIGIYADSNPHMLQISKWVSGSRTAGTSIGYSENTLYYITLQRAGTTLTLSVYSDAEKTTHISGSPQQLSVASTAFDTLNFATIDTGYNYQRSFYIQDFLSRKYTATEPTYTIGTPKNISTALKSFGRAG